MTLKTSDYRFDELMTQTSLISGWAQTNVTGCEELGIIDSIRES
jgi:hypothetical protein